MSNEKMKILEMLQEGKINASEASELLSTLDSSEQKDKSLPSSRFSNRFFRIRIDGDKAKVNVNIPLNLVKATSKLIGATMRYIPEEAHAEMQKKGFDLSQLDIEELIRLIDEELVDGKLVDIDADDPKEGKIKVEIYVE